MTSLIDRYVYTALRRVPEGQREDIDRELRASIDDAVDARVESGEERDAAVETTLLELGDPDRLADRYADRRGYLIGPELYPVWRKLLLTLLSTVLPVVVAVIVIVGLIDDPDPGKVIGAAVATLVQVGLHMAFWTTLVFAIVERTGVGRDQLRTTWSLKDLPRYDPMRQTPTQLALALVWPVMLVAALVLQQFLVTAQPVLNPANWSFWWPYLILVFALEGAYAVWFYRRNRLDRTATVANAVLALLFAVPVIWLLATERFFNPDLEWASGTAQHWPSLIVIAIVAFIAVWDIVDVAVRVERARRGVPTKVPGTGGSYTFG